MSKKEKINSCGKHTIIFEKENKYFAKIKRCNEWQCPYCGEKKKAKLYESITYYQELFKINNMLTLTTSGKCEELEKQFKKLLDFMSLFNLERYISKNGGDERKFNAYINNLIFDEAYYLWLCESKVQKGKKEYVPRVHYAIIFFEHMKNRTLDIYFKNIGIKGKHFDKYYLAFDKTYSKYNRYIDLKYKSEKLAYLFYNDYEPLFKLVYSIIPTKEKNSFIEKAKEIIEYNVSRNNEEKKGVEYVRIMERTKKGRIHFHIITNVFVPQVIFSKISTINSFSHDQSDFDMIIASEDNYESEIGKYIVKYITKDVNEEDNTNSSHNHEDMTNKRLITCSQNIKLNLSDPDSKGFKYYDQYDGACEKEFMEIEEDLFLFRMRIQNNVIEPTSLYKERKEIVSLVDKEKQRLQEDFKEQYFHLHDFFDTKTFKIERNEYVKKNIKNIEKYVERKLKLMDTIKMVRGEIIRHKDSPPIVEKSTYHDKNMDCFQNDFIRVALTSKGSISLSGGAGCGKSKCISSLVKAIPSDKKILCCSFTGKATSRLHELIDNTATNVTIETIHKACNSIWGQYTFFRNNENNLLPYDVCIIDEISMIDMFLLYCLSNALESNCKLIVVGDFNQLPPCENSSMEEFVEGKQYFMLKPLSKIFDNEFSQDYYFTRIKLFKNYRSDDSINALAYKFLSPYERDYFKDYNLNLAIYLIAMENYKVLCNINKVCKIINRRITTNFPIKGMNGYNYKIGQEIMFLQNDSQRGFYNGMLGTITNFNEITNVITINNSIDISFWETKMKIQPTYAMTIHKSQGSEIEKGIIILMNVENLLTSKIAYTSITRVKKHIILMKENGVDERSLHKKY